MPPMIDFLSPPGRCGLSEAVDGSGSWLSLPLYFSNTFLKKEEKEKRRKKKKRKEGGGGGR